MDPTTTELGSINTLSELLDWCGVVDSGDNLLRAEFNAKFGDPDFIRDVTLIPRDRYEAAMGECRVQGNPLSPVQCARILSARRVARLRCGLPAEESAPSFSAPDQAAQPPLPPPNTPPPGAQEATANTRKLKLNNVIDQCLDGEVVNMSPAATRRLFEKYEMQRGAQPHPDVEPTSEQLSAVSQLISDDVVPYVDFGIFVPYGKRALRRLTFTSVQWGVDGSYHKKEIPGPPDIDQWWQSWRLLKTTFLLLELVSPERLESYGEFFRNLANRFGPQCWFICYQAEVRMRSERMERLRRLEERDAARAAEAGLTHRFDAGKPWDAVFEAATKDSEFWQEHVKDQCLLYLSQVKSANQIVQEEDPTAALTGTGSGLSQLRDWGPVPPNTPPPGGAGGGRNRKRDRAGNWSNNDNSAARQDKSETQYQGQDLSNKDSDGKYTCNKKGNDLCHRFNRNECEEATNGICPRNPKRRHQCHWCLGDHSGKDCTNYSNSSGAKGGKKKKR